MMATSLVSRLALRGRGLGGLGGRVASATRPLHASAAVAGKHVWYPDIDTVRKSFGLVSGQPIYSAEH